MTCLKAASPTGIAVDRRDLRVRLTSSRYDAQTACRKKMGRPIESAHPVNLFVCSSTQSDLANALVLRIDDIEDAALAVYGQTARLAEARGCPRAVAEFVGACAGQRRHVALQINAANVVVAHFRNIHSAV